MLVYISMRQSTCVESNSERVLGEIRNTRLTNLHSFCLLPSCRERLPAHRARRHAGIPQTVAADVVAVGADAHHFGFVEAYRTLSPRPPRRAGAIPKHAFGP